MPSAGTDVADVQQPPESRGAYAGSTPGLYGGTLNNAECDRPTMISFLQTNPDKAAAWAAAQSLNPQDIPDYINKLTPLILRADTAVTNHGFADGKATELQSVLQAGTAVLVDAFGVPRARCACGNPLIAAEPQPDAQYAQPAWPRFNPSNVVTLQPSTALITEFPVIDVNSGNPFLRPAGSSGERDRIEAVTKQPAPTRATVPLPPKNTPQPTSTPEPARCPKGEKLVDGICKKPEPTCPPGTVPNGDGGCKKTRPPGTWCESLGKVVEGTCPPEPSEPAEPPPCKPGYTWIPSAETCRKNDIDGNR